jgi:hypothetical protein
MSLSAILLFIGGALQSFFPKDVAAQKVGQAMDDLGEIIASGGGNLPAFAVDGYEIGPIPVKKV